MNKVKADSLSLGRSMSPIGLYRFIRWQKLESASDLTFFRPKTYKKAFNCCIFLPPPRLPPLLHVLFVLSLPYASRPLPSMQNCVKFNAFGNEFVTTFYCCAFATWRHCNSCSRCPPPFMSSSPPFFTPFFAFFFIHFLLPVRLCLAVFCCATIRRNKNRNPHKYTHETKAQNCVNKATTRKRLKKDEKDEEPRKNKDIEKELGMECPRWAEDVSRSTMRFAF